MFLPHLLIMKIYLVKGKMGRLIVMDNISGFTNKLLKYLCNMLIATEKTLKSSYLISISISKSTYMFTACSLSNFSSKIKSAMLVLELFYVPL